MKDVRHLLSVLVLAGGFLFATNAMGRAGEGRNGGYGVYVNGKLYSLDLAEKSVHADPFIGSAFGKKLSEAQFQRLQLVVKSVVKDPVRVKRILAILEPKVSDLLEMQGEVLKPFDIENVIQSMGNFFWIYHGFDCLDVKDDDSETFKSKVQLAYRQGNWIRFCKQSLQLDDANLAALFLHEAVYASLRVKSATKDYVAFAFDKELMEKITEESRDQYKKIADDLNDSLARRIQILQNPEKYPRVSVGVYRSRDRSFAIKVTEVSYLGEVTGLVDENGKGLEIEAIKVIVGYSINRPAFIHSFKCDSDQICRHQSDIGSGKVSFIDVSNLEKIHYYQQSDEGRAYAILFFDRLEP